MKLMLAAIFIWQILTFGYLFWFSGVIHNMVQGLYKKEDDDAD